MFRGHDPLALSEAFDALPRPPWPAEWKCNDCGHRREEHASELVEDGRCLHAVVGCKCEGWDPLTTDQWATLFAAQRAGLA